MCLGDCTITSKAKINIFENVSSVPGSPSETFHSIFFQKMLTLAFEANDVLSCQNWLFVRILAHCVCAYYYQRKKKHFQKPNTSRASIVHLFENFSSCGRQTKKVLSFSIDFELQILKKQNNKNQDITRPPIMYPLTILKTSLMFCKSIPTDKWVKSIFT